MKKVLSIRVFMEVGNDIKKQQMERKEIEGNISMDFMNGFLFMNSVVLRGVHCFFFFTSKPSYNV